MNRYDEEIAKCIGVLWKAFPEQRFGQLLLNLARNEDGSIDHHRLWNMENDELMRLVFDAYVHRKL